MKEFVAVLGSGIVIVIIWILIVLGILAAKVWIVLYMLRMFGVI